MSYEVSYQPPKKEDHRLIEDAAKTAILAVNHQLVTVAPIRAITMASPIPLAKFVQENLQLRQQNADNPWDIETVIGGQHIRFHERHVGIWRNQLPNIAQLTSGIFLSLKGWVLHFSDQVGSKSYRVFVANGGVYAFGND